MTGENNHPLGLSNVQIDKMREFVKYQDEYSCLILISRVCTYCKLVNIMAGTILAQLHDKDPRVKAERLRKWLNENEKVQNLLGV